MNNKSEEKKRTEQEEALIKKKKNRENLKKFFVIIGFMFVGLIISSYLESLKPNPRQAKGFFKDYIRIGEILPECGDPDSSFCSYPMLAYAVPPDSSLRTPDPPYEFLSILPRPLLSSVRYDLSKYGTPGECPALLLVEELKFARSRSLELGKEGFAYAVSLDSSACLGYVSELEDDQTQVILLWNNGDINGWVDCSNVSGELRGCSIELNPRPAKTEDKTLPIGKFVIASFNVDELSILLKNLGKLQNRLYERASKKSQFLFNTSLPGDILHLDERTKKLLEYKERVNDGK